MPGKILKQATCVVSNTVCILNACRDVGRLTKFHVTSVVIAVIVASGGRFGEPNASKALADILVVLFPRNKVELKQRQTSGIMK